jgi:hypothetical protein
MGWGGQIMCPFQQQQQAFLFIFLCIWLFISQKEVARGLDIFSYDNVQGSLGSRHFSPALAIFSSLRSSFSFSQTPKFSFLFLFLFFVFLLLMVGGVACRWRLTSWWLFWAPFSLGSLNFFFPSTPLTSRFHHFDSCPQGQWSISSALLRYVWWQDFTARQTHQVPLGRLQGLNNHTAL